MNIISLGAGVQSSTMALMAAHGEITPMPDAAIFADTQAEPKAVYEWLDWLEKQLPFPVYRVTKGNLRLKVLQNGTAKSGHYYSNTHLPFYTLKKNGDPANEKDRGMIPMRGCTRDFKIAPIEKKIRELAHIKRAQKTVSVHQWIGISSDEASRMRESRNPWSKLRYPLIEVRMTRGDCLIWMMRRGYDKPPRSACVFCPFHNNLQWRELKTKSPDEFNAAVKFESDVQLLTSEATNFMQIPFLHPKRIPLDQVDFSTDEDRGQLNMFNNECEGMCGV